VDESERVVRLSLLFKQAVETLGSIEEARKWFKLPNRALGQATPFDYADTEPGAREVEDVLGRIANGVFA
jgi:putative toxin-antitoxin system antitoxin component (TIGR02293 family)